MRLGPDWDSHGGLPLCPEVHARVVRLLEELGQGEWPAPAVVLGSIGSVQLEWRVQGRELEIEILPQGEVAYLKSHADGQMEEGQVAQPVADAVKNLIGWVVSA